MMLPLGWWIVGGAGVDEQSVVFRNNYRYDSVYLYGESVTTKA